MLVSASMSILVGTLVLTWTAHTGLVTKVTLGDVSVSGEGSSIRTPQCQHRSSSVAAVKLTHGTLGLSLSFVRAA